MRAETWLLADVPIWMPDGENLLIGVDQMDDNGDETGAAVAIVPAAGGEPRYLTDFGLYGYFGIPNPTTGEIVLGTWPRELAPGGGGTGAMDAYAIKPDGTGLRQITHAAAGEHIYGPKWTPDGTLLLAKSSTQGQVTIDPTTGTITPISNSPANTSSPQLRPAELAQAGVELSDLEVVSPSLDDVFTHLTATGARP